MTELQQASDQRLQFVEQRRNLVRSLATKGISDQRVLTALERVPRDQFVPANERAFAYRDYGPSVSQR